MATNHIHIHKHIMTKKRIKTLDRVVLVASFLAPMSSFLQAYEIYRTGSAEGVSLVSWSGMMIFQVIFFAYGYVHKLKPIMISNALWLLGQIAIVAGILIYTS